MTRKNRLEIKLGLSQLRRRCSVALIELLSLRLAQGSSSVPWLGNPNTELLQDARAVAVRFAWH